jgi:hypothetical protein
VGGGSRIDGEGSLNKWEQVARDLRQPASQPAGRHQGVVIIWP